MRHVRHTKRSPERKPRERRHSPTLLDEVRSPVFRIVTAYCVLADGWQPARCDRSPSRDGLAKVVFPTERAAELAAGELFFLLGHVEVPYPCGDHFHLCGVRKRDGRRRQVRDPFLRRLATQDA